MRLAVVGGGAAGFFAAIQAGRVVGQAGAPVSVELLEATSKVLSKLRISGGGRCNLMHDPRLPVDQIASQYPRGRRPLRGALARFGPSATHDWFVSAGLELKTESDGRVFPVSDSALSVVRCLEREADRAGVSTRLKAPVTGVAVVPRGFALSVGRGAGARERVYEGLVLTTGSARAAMGWARQLGHPISKPVASLFALDLAPGLLAGLAGLSLPMIEVWLQNGSKRLHPRRGPAVVTHRGLSGPAVLQLSAFAARELHQQGYAGTVHCNLCAGQFERAEPCAERLRELTRDPRWARKTVGSVAPVDVPLRLWRRVAAELAPRRWGELGAKQCLALAEALCGGRMEVVGKSTNKDEFVTCGGVMLDGVDTRSLESKIVPRLYFAGELLDVDGVTGGYNFQSA